MKALSVGIRKSRFETALATAVLLITAVIMLRQALLAHGVLYYSDYSPPLSARDAFLMIHRYTSAWDYDAYLGRPNAVFFGTQIFLAAYGLLAYLFAANAASKILLVLFLLGGGLGMFRALNERFGPISAGCAALLYIANPWTYEQVLQGHIYLLEVLWLIPWLVYKAATPTRWDARSWLFAIFGYFLLIACDYHFATLIFGVFFLQLLGYVAVRKVSALEVLRRVSSVVVAVLLSAVFIVPYASVLRSVLSENAPGVQDLLYFSHYTSYISAITLLRPFMNSGDALQRMGPLYSPFWYLSYLVLAAFVVVYCFSARRDVRHATRILLLVSVLAFICGAGANGATGGLIVWAYVHVPFAAIFRDPSKFYIVPLLLYCWATAAACRRHAALAVAVAIVYAAPFVIAGNFLAQGFEYPGKDVAALVNPSKGLSFDQSYTATPPWNFVKYGWLRDPVHDPLVLYPTGSYVGIDYDYDNSETNQYLRWLFSELYFDKTSHFDALARTVGLSRIFARPLAEPVTGDAAEDTALRSSQAKAALLRQAFYRNQISDANRVQSVEVSDSWGLRAVTRLYELNGSDRDLIAALAEAGEDFRAAAPCFERECPAGRNIIRVGFVADAVYPIEHAAPLSLALDGVGTSRGFTLGSQKWAMMYGGLNSHRGVTLYESTGYAYGRLSFDRIVPQRSYIATARVLTHGYSARVRLRCDDQTIIDHAVPAAKVLTVETVIRGRAVTGAILKDGCEVEMWSPEAAILSVSAFDAVSERNSLPAIVFQKPSSQFVTSNGSLRAVAGPFENTEWALSSGRSILLAVPPQFRGRTLWGKIRATNALVRLSGRTRALSGNQFEWVRLGVVERARQRISVISGAIHVDLLAYTDPTIELPLHAVPASAYELHNKSAWGFDTANAEVVSWAQSGDRLWRLDGRSPSGKLAGFGQIYTVEHGKHRFSNTLQFSFTAGAIISCFTVFITVLIFGWRLRREYVFHRRSKLQ